MLETARPTSMARITAVLASAFATKMRRGERTAMTRWRHVPRRSSAAKTSPATRAVSSGSAQVHAKLSTTREAAHPVVNIHRPKTVSLGSELCPLAAAMKPAGASQQATRTTRTRHWREQLEQLEAHAGSEAGGTGHECISQPARPREPPPARSRSSCSSGSPVGREDVVGAGEREEGRLERWDHRTELADRDARADEAARRGRRRADRSARDDAWLPAPGRRVRSGTSSQGGVAPGETRRAPCRRRR